MTARGDASRQIYAHARIRTGIIDCVDPGAAIHDIGADAADLIDTIDHNLQHGATDPRFQRKVMYHSIPNAALPSFRKLSAAQAQSLLESFDEWLAAHDVDDAPGQPPSDRSRVGVGIYYFEEPVMAPDTQRGST